MKILSLFNTINYRNLIRFLNKGDYRVFVMGHSCGLSDRTMFKEIFDHEHCKSVRIFHYIDPSGENDFPATSASVQRSVTCALHTSYRALLSTGSDVSKLLDILDCL